MGDRAPRIVPSSFPGYYTFQGVRYEEPTSGFLSKEVIVSDDNPTIRGVKPCYHYRWRDDIGPLRGSFRNSWGSGEYYNKFHYNPLDDINRAVHEVAISLPPCDWDSAVQSVVPTMHNNFNLLNFAAEFDDVRNLYSSLHSNLSRLLNRRSISRGRLRRSLPSLQTLGESNLNYQLGVAPIVSDGRAIVDTLQNIGDRFSRASQNLHRGVRFAKRDTEHVYKVYPVQWDPLTQCEITIAGSFVRTYGGFVRGSLPYDPVRFLLDYLGVYPDLNTLWNSLPFTFVIDYFVPIGSALQSNAWLSPIMQIERSFYSEKFIGTYTLVVKSKTYFSEYTAIGQTISHGPCLIYNRYPMIAELDGIDPNPVRFPNLRQLGVLSSLGAANSGRRR